MIDSDTILIRAAELLLRKDNIVQAVFDDIGESPEAIRGAFIVAQAAGAMTDMIMDRTPGTERQVEAEMQGAGAVLGVVMSLIRIHAKELMS